MKLRTKQIASFCLVMCVALSGCVDPYEPSTSNQDINFLVVDGFINSTDSIATVKLSRAIKLRDSSSFPMERGASVFVIDDVGSHKSLSETSAGYYSIKAFFDPSHRYQLKITTAGKEYSTAQITLQHTPDIDSLSWKALDDRVEIYVSTHDFSEGFKYYRYSYNETYEYNSNYYSGWKLVGGTPMPRNSDEYIYSCWTTRPSTNLLLSTTENFSQNIISNYLLLRMNKGDRRLWRKHSLLVQQAALSKEAFQYWTQIQKMSESLGGLFDPMPYSIKGNIIPTTDPTETVLGYFSGSEVSSKRIVVKNSQLPRGFSGVLQTNCVEEYIAAGEVYTLEGREALLTRTELMGPFIIGYYYSLPRCVDCRLEGGTNVQPNFMQ